jgi:predicted nucleotidyltransferase
MTPDIETDVREALQRIARESGVRILLAVESGSRAWGFASPDSDYDVRFVYCHPRDWYISVLEPRDVIEVSLPGDLDVSGWDLRKALRLFAKSNVPLNEWLGSPVTYTEVPGFRERFLRYLPQYFNPIAGLYHYRSMADRALADGYVDGSIRIKKLFYALRPLLACRWIEHTDTQPPTGFSSLVASPWVTRAERDWIDDLLRQKAVAAERASIELSAERVAEIRAELDRYAATAPQHPAPQGADPEALNIILREWVGS